MTAAYRLYAGTQAGMILFRGVGDIWTSMGGSREFEPYFKDKVVDSVYGCRQNPAMVFAGVTFDGLYRTRDAGRHWQRVLEGDIRWVTVDPSDERVIYAGTEPVHLYRSEDGGDTWEELKSLIEMPPEVKYKWYFPHPPHEGHIRHINVDPENPKMIYLCIEHGRELRQPDAGRSRSADREREGIGIFLFIGVRGGSGSGHRDGEGDDREDRLGGGCGQGDQPQAVSDAE